MGFIDLLWLFIILAALQPAIQRRFLEISRRRALSRLAKEGILDLGGKTITILMPAELRART